MWMFASSTKSYNDQNSHRSNQNSMYLTMDRILYLLDADYGNPYFYFHGMHWFNLYTCRPALHIRTTRAMLQSNLRMYQWRM